MNKRGAWKTWVIVAAIILGSGFLTAAWPVVMAEIRGDSAEVEVEREREPITIHLEDYVLGEEVLVNLPLLKELNGQQVDPLLATAVLIAAVVGPLVAVGVGLALIYVRLDQQVVTTKGDSEVQQEVAGLARKEKERVKQLNAAQPADPIPSHKRPRWSAVSTGLLVLCFVWLIGALLANSVEPITIQIDDYVLGREVFLNLEPFQNIQGAEIRLLPLSHEVVRIIVWGLVLLTAVALVLTLKPQRLEAIEAHENDPLVLPGLTRTTVWYLLVALMVAIILIAFLGGVIGILTPSG